MLSRGIGTLICTSRQTLEKIFIFYMDSKALKFTRFGALAGHIQHMAAQKVGFTPRPIRYGPPNWQVSSLTALKYQS
jgi:hypothetical protein